VLGGARSVLGLIGLVGGATTVVIGVVSFLNEGTWHDFLIRVGVAYLVMAPATAVYLLYRRVELPQGDPETVAGWVWYVIVATGFFAGLAVLAALIADEITVLDAIEFIGAAALWTFGSSILMGRHEIVSFVRESSKPSRPCPRCGHSVRAGVMKCPTCEFDFWSVGRDGS
jgi:hypothetical protein